MASLHRGGRCVACFDRIDTARRKIIFLTFTGWATITFVIIFLQNVSLVPAPSLSSFAIVKISGCAAMTSKTENAQNQNFRKCVCYTAAVNSNKSPALGTSQGGANQTEFKR